MLNRKVEKYGMTYMAVERVDNLVLGGIAIKLVEEEEETCFGVEPLTILVPNPPQTPLSKGTISMLFI